GWPYLHVSSAIPALAYLTDYQYGHVQWMLQHTWSLAVEEQFYLLWPALLFLCRPRRALYLAAAVIATGPLMRAWTMHVSPGLWQYYFHCQADALATGCVLVAIRLRLRHQRWYRRLLDSPMFWCIPVAAILIREMPNVTMLITSP